MPGTSQSRMPIGEYPIGQGRSKSKHRSSGRHHRRRAGASDHVGEVNGRIFLNNSSIGVYPWIVRERQKDEGKGYGKWEAFGWGVISILHRYSLLHVHLRVDDQEELISIWRTGCSRNFALRSASRR
jgi:hypothetical protein